MRAETQQTAQRTSISYLNKLCFENYIQGKGALELIPFVTLWSYAVLCALKVLSICLLYLTEAPQAGVFLLGKSRSHCSWTLAVLGILSHHIWSFSVEHWVVDTQLTPSCACLGPGSCSKLEKNWEGNGPDFPI